MIYPVKTSKSDVIYVIVFNVVYNFVETLLKLLQIDLHYLNGNLNTRYKICVIWSLGRPVYKTEI